MAGAWRQAPERLTVSDDEVSQIAPLLLATGTAALAWRRIESFDLTGRPFPDLKDAYRKHLIEAAVHDVNTQDIFHRVNAAGIDAVLFKGWALARLYPDAGLRPYGDIDLWVSLEKLDGLYSALPSGKDYAYCVEPHVSFFPQYERSFDDVLNRSQLLHLNGIPVRIPGDEDHLRFICLHFLYHGGWRPLWLCDVALMVEAASSDFDWDRCLSGNRKHSDWIACVIGLAYQLLNADISRTPVQQRAKSLPRWLTDAVLRQWGKGPGMSLAENLSFSIPRRLLKPTLLFRAFREHYRNPIQASVEMNAWFSDSPRSLFQVGSVFLRIPEFARSFGREIRRT
jgi:Uncharacterised nucleotidyltransferase